MKYHSLMLAGTALGLVLSAGPLAAREMPERALQSRPAAAESGAILLAQASDDPQDEEELKKRRQQQGQRPRQQGQPQGGQPQRREQQQMRQEQQPRREMQRQEQPQGGQPQRRAQQQMRQEQQPRREQQRQEQAPRREQPQDRPTRREQNRPSAQGDEPLPGQPPAAPRPPAGGNQPPAAPKPPAGNQPPAGARPPQGGQPPAQGQPPQGRPPQGGQPPAANQPPAAPRPPQGGTPPSGGDEPLPGQPPAAPRPPAGGGQPPAGNQPPAGARPPQGGQPPAQGQPPQGRPPQGGTPPSGGDEPLPGQPPAGARPPQGSQPPAQGQPPQGRPPQQGGQPPANMGGDEPVRQRGRTPVLDSQKEQGPRGAGPAAPGGGQPPAAAPAGPPPRSDRDAQRGARPERFDPVTQEQGRRIAQPRPRLDQRPEGSNVVREFDDNRVIFNFDNRAIIESSDRPRMTRNARDVYYEELPRGRQRETIVRPDGTRVVTIRNRFGDVVRRSRFLANGQEIVLVYVDEDRFDAPRDVYLAGRDLPPLVLTIPVEDYILDAESVSGPDDYYRFLDQPPVEAVERLYTIDEVKYSARIRDKTRRIDLDTINFEFGSASIAESEIPRLEGVASAMERLLQANPAETFLIEGHTDAVGSDTANLALSDRRAESVAQALTNVFGIPAENLATQGYGEQYLKVDTASPERENRRVAIRRITALVAPVASAQ